MSEEEDCDDLPQIKVNSSANDSSSFTMPSAEELATQRARELDCERQLQELRSRDCDRSLQRPAPLRHSDSSGSEADLAAAVTALHVRARPAPPAAPALWAALAPRLPAPARRLPAQQLPRLARALAGAALSPAPPGAAWPDADMLCACALLCVLLLARDSRTHRIAARALHALLDDHATSAQVSDLVRVLLASFPSARTRLQLSDALRSGGDAGADRAAAAITSAALLDLLQQATGEAEMEGKVGAGEAEMEGVVEAGEAERDAGIGEGEAEMDAGVRAGQAEMDAGVRAGEVETDAGVGAREAEMDAGVGSGEAPSVDRVARAAAAWRYCEPEARYTCVQLAGRLLAATRAPCATSATPATAVTSVQQARARLLAQLAPQPGIAGDAQRPDRLKVLVGASKLRLLFCTEQ